MSATVLDRAVDEAAGQRWLAHMLAGDYASAWRESDAIRRRNAADSGRFWQGDDLRGQRVILRCLHGYGDAVQFFRYIPLLQASAFRLTIEVPPALVEIAPFFEGIQDVITWGSNAPAEVPAWDLQAEIMELPYIFKTNLSDLPIATNYLRLTATEEQHAASILGKSRYPRVGVTWAGGAWNSARSLPVSLLQPLLNTSGYEFWNLQGGAPREELRHFEWAANVREADMCSEGILHLAAAIGQLDLVLTVDTLAAHLAGAMGKPVWILLPYAADWRWMKARSDSPWYPTATLFRQSQPGDWSGVINAVQHKLEKWRRTRHKP